MMSDKAKKDNKTGEDVENVDSSIKNSLTFRVSMLSAFSEKVGNAHFQRKFQIKLTEWRVIALTGSADWTAIRTIRRPLLIDKGQFSRLVKDLINRGYLISRQSPKDARLQEIKLSDEGEELYRAGIKFVEELNDITYSVLSPEEREQFSEFLDRLIERKEFLIAQEFSS
jgi:DNA-binding MarR family transcriptional regulator